MIGEIEELFQSFIAPQLEGIKGDIRVLDSKLESKIDGVETKIGSLDVKVESYRRELLAEIRRVEQGTYLIEKTLSTDFSPLEQKVDLSLAAMTEKMDVFRREMLAEIKAASK